MGFNKESSVPLSFSRRALAFSMEIVKTNFYLHEQMQKHSLINNVRLLSFFSFFLDKYVRLLSLSIYHNNTELLLFLPNGYVYFWFEFVKYLSIELIFTRVIHLLAIVTQLMLYISVVTYALSKSIPNITLIKSRSMFFQLRFKIF